MAFPTSPTNGQQANINGITYTYSSAATAWTVSTSVSNTFVSINVSDNVNSGNVLATGVISATGNVSGGNLVVTGNIIDTGALTIVTGSNGNITLSPNGTGIVTTTGAISTTGNISANNATFTSNQTLSYGTANGVGYLDGSKVLTTGSALVFDGTNFSTTGSATVKNLFLTGGALPGAGNPSIALRSSDNFIYHQSGSANNITFLDSAQNTMYSMSATAHSWNISNANKMLLDASGNLGVGTNSPAKKLQINSSDTTDGIRLYCSDPGGENLSIVWQSAYGPNTITGDIKSNASGTGGNFILRTANTSAVLTEALRVDNAQNLLVGTTTKNNDGKISISASSALNQGMTIKETSATNDIYYILFTNSAGATAGRIEHTGATTVNYTSGSDVRLKTNIVDAGSAKEKIEAIKIREFDWITGEHQKFGVIAQELIEVAPEAVCAGRTENDHWGVDYSKIVPSLIKYVQEQQALITQLTARITALEEA